MAGVLPVGVLPVVAGIIGILSGRGSQQQAPPVQMQPLSRSPQPGMRRTWDTNQNKYVNTGPGVGGVQPGQVRAWNDGTQSYQNAPQQPSGFQDWANKAMNIANIVSMLRRPKQQAPVPQMRYLGR